MRTVSYSELPGSSVKLAIRGGCDTLTGRQGGQSTASSHAAMTDGVDWLEKHEKKAANEQGLDLNQRVDQSRRQLRQQAMPSSAKQLPGTDSFALASCETRQESKDFWCQKQVSRKLWPSDWEEVESAVEMTAGFEMHSLWLYCVTDRDDHLFSAALGKLPCYWLALSSLLSISTMISLRSWPKSLAQKKSRNFCFLTLKSELLQDSDHSVSAENCSDCLQERSALIKRAAGFFERQG